MCTAADRYISSTITHMNQNPSYMANQSKFSGTDRCNALFECIIYNISNNSNIATPKNMVLVLDNIDTLLHLSTSVIGGQSSNDDDLSDNEEVLPFIPVDSQKSNIYSERVSLVFKLLCLVTKARCSYPIVIFGITCCVQQKLHHKFPLARRFESVTAIGKPSMNDNRNLFLYCMDKLLLGGNGSGGSGSGSGGGNKYQLEDISSSNTTNNNNTTNTTSTSTNDNNNANTAEWADRICGILFNSKHNNGLTGGYLPIDMVELVKGVHRTHEGSIMQTQGMGGSQESTVITGLTGSDSHSESESDSDSIGLTSSNKISKIKSGSGNIILWKTALLCCSSFTPIVLRQASRSKILRKVGSTSAASNTSSIDSDDCSWEAYGGYTHIRLKLTRLLSLMGGGSNNISKIQAPRGLLLYGPTGCGKTFLAKVIASEARMSFISIRSTELLGKYYGETEATIRGVFSQARAIAPCVLFFDEFDAIACRRSGFGSSGGGDKDDAGGWRNRVLSTLLNEMDGIGSTGGSTGGDHPSILIITACQSKDVVDEALLRPGRLQYHFHLQAPALEDIYDILSVKMRNIFSNGLVTDADSSSDYSGSSSGSGGNTGDSILVSQVHELANKLHQLHATGADIDSVCHRAILNSIKEVQYNMNHKIDEIDEENSTTIVSINHFYKAISDLWPGH